MSLSSMCFAPFLYHQLQLPDSLNKPLSLTRRLISIPLHHLQRRLVSALHICTCRATPGHKVMQPTPHSTTTTFNRNHIQPPPHSTATTFNHNHIQPQPHSTTTTFNHNHIQPPPHSTTTTFSHHHIQPQPHSTASTCSHQHHTVQG